MELENGSIGQITLGRIAHGVPNSLGLEVFGTHGHARFDSVRAGEFQVCIADEELPPLAGAHNVMRVVGAALESSASRDASTSAELSGSSRIRLLALPQLGDVAAAR